MEGRAVETIVPSSATRKAVTERLKMISQKRTPFLGFAEVEGVVVSIFSSAIFERI
jgi:hypothetical protein